MADLIFENPRLVEIYDCLDGHRGDLEHYVALAKKLNARTILDVGSGTGCFAVLAAEHGFQVTGVEPALASLDWARQNDSALILPILNGGKAVDMKLSPNWAIGKSVAEKSGTKRLIRSKRDIVEVAATYGVLHWTFSGPRSKEDDPHWSETGN